MPAEQAAAIAVEISGERRKEEDENNKAGKTPSENPTPTAVGEPELQKP
jgi:hypothetical protein